ncbi:MAG: fibronectin type III domain-containing protein [Clostridia bacterium]|nr:fibronectin type III domain-containing protein [Clostridia bacterium]
MQDIQVKSFYEDLKRNDYISTDLMVSISMEWFLATLLMKGDYSRVMYSKEDIVFRRRIEQVGRGFVKGENNHNNVTLDLPFAAYSEAGSYEEDDRAGSMNTAMAVKGWMCPETGIVVKAQPVKINYQATIFFSSRHDTDVAAQLLYWEQHPRAPIYTSIENDVAGTKVDVPVNITIESVDKNPDYSQKRELTEARIFPVKVGFTVRTYQILIEDVDNVIKLPIRFSGIYAYNDEDIVFTQKTALVWANTKWAPHLISRPRLEEMEARDMVPDRRNTVLVGASDNGEALYTDEFGKEAVIPNSAKTVKEQIDDVVADTIEGYFSEERNCVLETLEQSSQTENSVTIHWEIKESTILNFKSITFYIPGFCSQGIYDSSQTDLTIEGLNPGSVYNCTIICYSDIGTKLTYNLTLKTEGKQIIPTGGTGRLSDKLIGYTFQR